MEKKLEWEEWLAKRTCSGVKKLMKLMDWFSAMVRRLCITLTDMTSCSCSHLDIQLAAEFQPVHQPCMVGGGQLRVHLPHLEEAVDHPSLEQVHSGDELPLAQVWGEGVDQNLRLLPGQAGHLPHPALLLHAVPYHLLCLLHQGVDLVVDIKTSKRILTWKLQSTPHPWHV